MLSQHSCLRTDLLGGTGRPHGNNCAIDCLLCQANVAEMCTPRTRHAIRRRARRRSDRSIRCVVPFRWFPVARNRAELRSRPPQRSHHAATCPNPGTYHRARCGRHAPLLSWLWHVGQRRPVEDLDHHAVRIGDRPDPANTGPRGARSPVWLVTGVGEECERLIDIVDT
jgi:hypothetical protein